VLLIGLFAIAYPQSPLFTDNQTTKFLHGAAQAGVGQLSSDWTAGTVDPLPLFTLVIEWLYRFTGIWASHLAFAALAGVYAWALWRIVRRVFPEGWTTPVALMAAALMVLLHNTKLSGVFIHGFSGQYVLGSYFQPAVLGVLVLVAVERFLSGRPLTAALALAVATAFHPGAYFFASVLLLVAYPWAVKHNGYSIRRLVAPAAVFLLCLLPLALYTALMFWPQSYESLRESVRVLAEERIPHHTQVGVWFDGEAALKVAVMLGGLWVARADRVLFRLLALPVGFILASAVMLALFSNAFASLATPWRVSAVVMPLCASLLVARLAVTVKDRLDRKRRVVLAAFALVLGLALATGPVRAYRWSEKYDDRPETSLIAFARANGAVGQRYMLPPRQGSLERFRLETGLPVVVNWKTHPYLDLEVFEWLERNRETQAFYDERMPDERGNRLAQLRQRYGITHVVVSAEGGPMPVWAHRVFDNGAYRVYELGEASPNAP